MSHVWTEETPRPEPPRARVPRRRDPFNAKSAGLHVAPEERRPSLGLAFAVRREKQRPRRRSLLERGDLHRLAWVVTTAVALALTVEMVGRMAGWR